MRLKFLSVRRLLDDGSPCASPCCQGHTEGGIAHAWMARLAHHRAARGIRREVLHMHEVLQQVVQGFSGLSVVYDTQQTAMRHLKQWLAETPFVPYRPQLEWLIA